VTSGDLVTSREFVTTQNSGSIDKLKVGFANFSALPYAQIFLNNIMHVNAVVAPVFRC
jgi:hypothetical protein